ncbi:accessory Sec system S-layer assembly protein [Thermaerobacillus caldiproteolyticus]|uniref:Accessory Sec system S-layer assembly protein n=1 Tax=Thermaerobacillus caldiproteolyticus TaxID=247480 RepID=A0A7V9Z5W0_9BACL|nr:accessory Sec system S-layer assembly protein [Anoxybacillus caldiproteolyticus]MBA2874561.1 accessory Sec system S-layer assembly protein [Anoxybacillus caldiproteolyticus]QPA30763.1 accessory Sec system S-layer assembly protein [Anoxybacillus caldiproteolyticus]
MLSFFKRGHAKQDGLDTVVDSNELFSTESAHSTDEEIHPELSFHPTWSISVEERYYYQFLNNEQKPLKENQVSLSGIELKQVKQGYMVTAFVRSSLPKPITFSTMPLLLIGPNGEILARKVFDLSELGEIPPRSSRPWKFLFEHDTLRTSEIPAVDWKLAFELTSRKTHSLDLAESWEKSLADEDKQKLQSLVQSIQPPKPGEVNFMGLQIQQTEHGDLHVTLLIRNGSDKNIEIQQLPLQVEDAAGDIVARGAFTLNDFEVKANTSKPWTFIFPKSLVTKENPDFRSWKVSLPQTQES